MTPDSAFANYYHYAYVGPRDAVSDCNKLILLGQDTTSRHFVYGHRCIVGMGRHRNSKDAAIY